MIGKAGNQNVVARSMEVLRQCFKLEGAVGVAVIADDDAARALAVVDAAGAAAVPGVPPITRDFPAFAKFLPWGPFYGVFVKRDTPDDMKARLIAAFHKGAASAEFQKFLTDFGAVSMNISGKEADAFLTKWQSVTAWLLHDAGATKVSPETLGIARP